MKLTFNKDLCCANKAQQLNATNFGLAGYAFPWTAFEFERLLQDVGITPQQWYEWYGAAEGVNPYPEIDCFLMLTDEIRELLETVNKEVNNRIVWTADSVNYGVSEWWSLPKHGKDDCDGYAIAKDKELAKHGIQGMLLFLRIPGRGNHVVLCVHTNEGDKILDDRYKTVKDCDELDCQWDVIETTDGWKRIKQVKNRFVTIGDGAAPAGYKYWLVRKDYNKNTW